MKKYSLFLLLAIAGCYLYEIFFIENYKAHGWHAIKGIYVVIGFVSGWQLMPLAKTIASWFLYQDENFYKEKRS